MTEWQETVDELEFLLMSMYISKNLVLFTIIAIKTLEKLQ
jgi:hypothetical protein